MSTITTKLVIDYSSDRGTIIHRDSYEYDGPVDKACGPTSEQNRDAQRANNFAVSLNNHFESRFKEQSDIMKEIHTALNTHSGPGMSDEERAARNKAAIENTAGNFRNATTRVQSISAGRNIPGVADHGGDSGLQSGVDASVQAQLAGDAAASLSRQEGDIIGEDYAIGRQERQNNIRGMEVLSGQMDTSNLANETEKANEDSNLQDERVAQARAAKGKLIGGLVQKGLGLGASFLTGGLSNMGQGSGVGDFFKGGLERVSRR